MELAHRLYIKNPSQYTDLRRFHTLPAIQKRLRVCATLITAIPESKRRPGCARYLKLRWEQLMLKWKYRIYVYKGDAMPVR